MSPAFSNIKTMKLVSVACLTAGLFVLSFMISPLGHGQTQETPRDPKSQTGQDQSDVLRVYTEIVQTDVMIFDKQGRFVDGLKSSDFELRIDGKPKPVEFFEKVTAGSTNEESQIAAARGSASRPNVARSARPAPLDRGRPIYFFVDDLHLDLASMQTTRKLITRFIDQQMGQNDEVAISSASGQIGFLQQLTNNKAVLRAALERLKVRPYSVRDFDRPTMTEYQALLITNYDRDTTAFFIDATLRLNQGMQRQTAEALVNSRALAVAQQGGAVTVNTLASLESLVRSANALPGRKLVFFISGGFFLDDRNSNSRDRLQRITSAAARSNVVIYSMDGRGLVASLNDISIDAPFDPTNRLQQSNSGELRASQDGLNALAVDTGGRAVFNTNSLAPGLERALKDTASYYLLAWKPDQESQQRKFRRIEVKVAGRPELTVQVRRGFFDRAPDSAKTEKVDKSKKESNATTAKTELQKAILAPYPNRDVPFFLSLSYLNTVAKGMILSTSLEVPNEVLSFVPVNGKHTAVVSIAGVVLDDKGNVGANFNNRITVEAPSVEAIKEGPNLTYGYPVHLKPGLYQVRIGVRDETSGRTGTVHDWIEIPGFSPGQLALGSLMLGKRTSSTTTPNVIKNPQDPIAWSINHNFSSGSYLQFLIIAYNATTAPTDSKPDLALQIQIMRDAQPVVTTALRKISVEGVPDLARIPYAAEVSLSGLPVGRYLLQVTVVDRVAKKSASQQSRFEIE